MARTLPSQREASCHDNRQWRAARWRAEVPSRSCERPRHIHQTKGVLVDRSGWREEGLGHERRFGLVSSSADKPDKPDMVAGATVAAETTLFPVPLGLASRLSALRSNPMADAHEIRGHANGERLGGCRRAVDHGQLRLRIAADQPRWFPSPQIVLLQQGSDQPPPATGQGLSARCLHACAAGCPRSLGPWAPGWSWLAVCPASAPDGNWPRASLPNRASQAAGFGRAWSSSASTRRSHALFRRSSRLENANLSRQTLPDPGRATPWWRSRRELKAQLLARIGGTRREGQGRLGQLPPRAGATGGLLVWSCRRPR